LKRVSSGGSSSKIQWNTELRTLKLRRKENSDQKIVRKIEESTGILLENSRGCQTFVGKIMRVPE
jgi:thiazole synthase ThiGH ThiG subunit